MQELPSGSYICTSGEESGGLQAERGKLVILGSSLVSSPTR